MVSPPLLVPVFALVPARAYSPPLIARVCTCPGSYLPALVPVHARTYLPACTRPLSYPPALVPARPRPRPPLYLPVLVPSYLLALVRILLGSFIPARARGDAASTRWW